MAIYKGNKKVVAVYKGSTPINKIYKGSTLVFQKSGGGGSTHLFEGTATGTFYLSINDNGIPITPDADGKWFYDTDEKITKLTNAFFLQSAVTSVDLSNLDLTGIDTGSMFQGSSNITSIKFNNTKSMKLKYIDGMFSDCKLLTSINLSSFDTSSLTSASSLFSDCSSLVSLDVSKWDTSNFTDAGYLFTSCSKLVSLDLSNWDTSSLTYAISLFNSCSSLVSLDLSNFDMSKATHYNYMFAGCTSLSTIKCKQAFKDWCITHQDDIYLPDAMREGGTGTWTIVN